MLTAEWRFVVAVGTVGDLVADLTSVDAVIRCARTLPLVNATRRYSRYTRQRQIQQLQQHREKSMCHITQATPNAITDSSNTTLPERKNPSQLGHL